MDATCMLYFGNVLVWAVVAVLIDLLAFTGLVFRALRMCT